MKIIKIEFIDVEIFVHYGDAVKNRNGIRKKWSSLPKFEGKAYAMHTAYYELYYGKHWLFLPVKREIDVYCEEVCHLIDTISDEFEIRDKEFRGKLFGYIINNI